MVKSNDPMDPLRKAHEEEYFHQQNRRLLEELRSRSEIAARAGELESATQVHDKEVLEQLAALGIEADQVPLLHLAPLVEVAWADGKIQAHERELIEQAAADHGVTKGSAAHDALERMLAAPPAPEFFQAACTFIGAVLATLPVAEADASRASLEQLAREVAKVTGGLLGLFQRVDPVESAALKRISARLDEERAAAVKRALDQMR